MKRQLGLAAVLVCAACVRAPPFVLPDRATALEEQAAGSFDELEHKLARAGIAPRPVPFTPEELEALGIREADLVNTTEMTDADRLDQLLKQHCVGEGQDGLLTETPAACRGATDQELARKLVERSNSARTQLWRWLQAERPSAKPEEVRHAWQLAHSRGVTCGAWMQGSDGKWEPKKC
jgi:uncharacterized protein YdbL (DUF1318 family)